MKDGKLRALRKFIDLERKSLKIIDQFNSSLSNKYCLFCRSEIESNNHFCEQIKKAGDEIISILEVVKKEVDKHGFDNSQFEKIENQIILELNSDSLKNQDFAQVVKNKILMSKL